MNEEKISKTEIIRIFLYFSQALIGLIIFAGYSSSPKIGFLLITFPLINLIIEIILKNRELKKIKKKIDEETTIVAQWSYHR